MLELEIAKSQEKKAIGLMHRKFLPENKGMVFIFKYANNLSFWGLNTYIPLDIAFIDEDMIIQKISKIKKLSKDSVSSDSKCVMAIEVNEGYFEKKGIKEGDILNIYEINKTHDTVKVFFNEKD